MTTTFLPGEQSTHKQAIITAVAMVWSKRQTHLLMWMTLLVSGGR